MRSWLHYLLAVPIGVGGSILGIWLFSNTIDREELRATLFTLQVSQVHYLLVTVVSLVLLYESVDEPLRIARLMRLLFGSPRVPRERWLSIAWWVIACALLTAGVLIPLLDLLEGIPADAADWPTLAPKLALLLVVGAYVFQLVDRPKLQDDLLTGLVSAHGTVACYDRSQGHNEMSSVLDGLADGEQVLLTSFEEPRKQLAAEGFYYEQEFMEKWYRVIREKKLKVRQIVLVNSDSDIVDVERRLELVGSIPDVHLGCLIAPPLLVFVDLFVVPGKLALMGMSDDSALRNMYVFDVALRGGSAVARIERVFTHVLAPEAIWVKTFEGVDQAALEKVRERAHSIAKTPSRVLRGLFGFTNLEP